jgi:hypothetical protein
MHEGEGFQTLTGQTYEEAKRIADLTGRYLPSPDEIRRATAEIRARWPDGVQQAHARHHKIAGWIFG